MWFRSCSYVAFSNTFENPLSWLSGLWFSGVFSPFFLSIGLILASLSVLGNFPHSKPLFIIRFSGVTREAADMFISFAGIPSNPDDFFGLIDFIIFHVFSLLMFLSVRVLDCLSFGSSNFWKDLRNH